MKTENPECVFVKCTSNSARTNFTIITIYKFENHWRCRRSIIILTPETAASGKPINPYAEKCFFLLRYWSVSGIKTGKKHADFDVEKDATYRLTSPDCAGRVSVSLTVMLQESRTPVEVEGNSPYPTNRYYCYSSLWCAGLSKSKTVFPAKGSVKMF